MKFNQEIKIFCLLCLLLVTFILSCNSNDEGGKGAPNRTQSVQNLAPDDQGKNLIMDQISINDQLINGAADGNIDIVNEAIEKGADVNVKTHNGLCPLYFATFYKHKEIVELLLLQKLRINPNITDHYGKTVLNFAASNDGYVEFVELLLRAQGADPNLRDNMGNTPLNNAVRFRLKDVATILIAHGVDPNLQNNRGQTPLHNAVLISDVKMVELLLKIPHINPELTDKFGNSPLSLAKKFGEDEIVKLLELKR